MVGYGGGREVPEAIEQEARFWASSDGRFREEREQHVTVRGPQGVVMWSPELGAVLHERDDESMRTTVHELLDPMFVAVGYALELLGGSTVAGRDVRRIRATPRGPMHRHGLPMGADEVELAVDLERGVLLRSEARFEGGPFAVQEVLAVDFDVELPEETFVFALPPGERLRTPAEAFPWAYVSVEEAAARATFTVLVPSGLDSRWKLNAIHRDANERARTPETVHLLFFDDGLHNFAIEEAGERLPAWRSDVPEVVVREGVELRVLEGSRPGPPTEVHLERAGTHVRISSDTLDRERLLAVAASLVEAPTELPPVV